MLKLGLNIDHIATLRQARYRDVAVTHQLAEPSPLAAAQIALSAGAHAITAHLREDRRHIQDEDVRLLKTQLSAPLNLEMAITDAMVANAVNIKPDDACLVPENRREVTTEGGLDVCGQLDRVTRVTQTLQAAGIRVSLFIDPDPAQIRAAQQCGAPCIELHTGSYANSLDPAGHQQQLRKLVDAAQLAHSLGLQVNAGHGLNYHNLSALRQAVPHLDTLNIGHSIVSRALFVGLIAAVKEILLLMNP